MNCILTRHCVWFWKLNLQIMLILSVTSLSYLAQSPVIYEKNLFNLTKFSYSLKISQRLIISYHELQLPWLWCLYLWLRCAIVACHDRSAVQVCYFAIELCRCTLQRTYTAQQTACSNFLTIGSDTMVRIQNQQ